jgi:hypothetical protein
MLNVNDRLSLRFKRLRSGLTTSNILTGQQVQLQLQLPIDGLEAPTNAVVGYVPNETSSGVSRLAVVCRHAGRLLWVLDLPTAEDGAQPAKLPDGVGPRAPRIGPGEGAIEINTRDQRLTGS